MKNFEQVEEKGKLKGTRLLVKPINTEKKTKKGIWMPESADILTNIAEVIMVGTDCGNKKWMGEYDYQIGDTIIFDSRSGADILIDDVAHKVLESNETWFRFPKDG